MSHDEDFLEFALLNIYAHNNVQPDAGGRLDHESLSQEWASYHLDQEDLDRALNKAVADGRLREEHDEDGVNFAVTDRAVEDINGSKSLMSRWRELKYMARLSRMQAVSA